MKPIKITTTMVLNVTVNCYLIETDNGFFMVDTGMARQRRKIENEMLQAGCKPGNLKLIMLTHGDFDHCGNAVYFSQKFGAKIAMHRDDSGMIEFGNMFWNRKEPNIVVKSLMGLFVKLDKADQSTPDVFLEDSTTLDAYGLEASVLRIPGHSKGSLGLLLPDGDLFCGDLLANRGEPDLWMIIDDQEAAEASVEKLLGMEIATVYPGHGDPFPFSKIKEKYTRKDT